MDTLLLGITWSITLLGGIWVGLGVASGAMGRLLVNPSRTQWSRKEVELLAVNMVVQGLGSAVYSLAGGLILTSHQAPFWVGHTWAIFIPALFFIFLLATQGFQVYVAYLHQQRVRGSTTQEAAR